MGSFLNIFDHKEINHLDKGKFGEDKACKYLKKKGYKIVERNYHLKFAEIDIIARDEKTYVFVEVKTRKLGSVIPACLSVDYTKQQKIMRASCCYLKNKKIKPLMRFDIIEVYTDEEMKKYEIHHIKNAFGSRSDYAVF